MAILGSGRLRTIYQWPSPVIRIDAIWLATEPMDMRAGTETALARVVAVFGAAKPHCAYLFANRRACSPSNSMCVENGPVGNARH